MSTCEVLADSYELMTQAPGTAEHYLHAAITMINRLFDDETYAKNHPELVAAFITVCATDFQTAMLKAAAQDLRDSIDGVAEGLQVRA
jgi:hypothetical protein